MRLNELFESTLPLMKGQIRKARSMYGAFIITMDPKDFLYLTSTPEDYQKILAKKFPVDREQYLAWGLDDGDANFGKFEMPFLGVGFPSGRIYRHEGRHRAAMIMRQGGKNFPVIIYPEEDPFYIGKIEYFDNESKKQIWTTPEYPDKQSAYDAAKTKSEELAMDENNYILRLRSEYNSGSKLRGAPDRSDRSTWDHAKWTKEDFPKALIGQYERSREISKFRIGLVKGYRHHIR